MTPAMITQQPISTLMHSDKRVADVDHRDGHHHEHKSCHRARLRGIIIPAIFVLFTVATIALLEFGDFDSGGMGAAAGLLRRATGDANGNGDTPFVKNKLYLIVVLVGLFLVLVAAIALSFWCCKGAFQNPLCCPCYLCACCGGLACLECISCGLCAEGLEDLNV